jgi:hypothetical protein
MTGPVDSAVRDAAIAALKAEVEYARTARQAVWSAPSQAQVERLIRSAWPVITGPGEARLGEVRDTVAGFLAHHGNASIASLRFAQDLAHGILQVCDKNMGTGDTEAISVLAADRAAVIDALRYTITHAGGEAPKKRYVEALTRRGEEL